MERQKIKCDRCGRTLHEGELYNSYNNAGGVCNADGRPYGCYHIFIKGECGDNDHSAVDRCIYCGSTDYGGSCSGRLDGGVHIHGMGTRDGVSVCVYCGRAMYYGADNEYCIFSPVGKHRSSPVFFK